MTNTPTVGRPLLAAALLACLVAAPAGALASQKETERVDRTIPFSPGGLLKLKNFSGQIRITTSSEEQVVISAIRRGTRERLDEVKLTIDADPRQITINANQREGWWPHRKSQVVETEFEIAVPARTELDIDAFSSDIRIVGVEDRQTLNTFSGGITVRDALGPLHAKTFSGDVHVEVRDGVLSPDLDLKTFSGDITARVGGQASAQIRFNTFSGELHSDLPLLLESGNRRNLTARLNQGGGSELYFKTFSGDVRIVRE